MNRTTNFGIFFEISLCWNRRIRAVYHYFPLRNVENEFY